MGAPFSLGHSVHNSYISLIQSISNGITLVEFLINVAPEVILFSQISPSCWDFFANFFSQIF